MTKKYEYHEAANIFPLDRPSISKMAKDIKEQGLLDPITIFENKILDGRRRSLACEEAGVTPRYDILEECENPAKFVVSKNIHRRHLDKSQMSIYLAKASELSKKYEVEAEQRMQEGKSEGGKTAGRGRPKQNSTVAQRRQSYRDQKSTEQLGKEYGVGGRTIQKAKRVLKDAIPEVVDAVESGKVKVTTADNIAKLPKEKQSEALRDAVDKVKPSAKKGESKETDVDKLSGREKAGRIADDIIDYLTRSPLTRMAKNNPNREFAFEKVIRWLRQTLKGAK